MAIIKIKDINYYIVDGLVIGTSRAEAIECMQNR